MFRGGECKTNKKVVGLSIGLVCIGVLVGAFTMYSFQEQFYRYATLNIDVGTMSLHVTTYIQRANETEPRFWSYHAGQLMTIGKNWIEDQLGDSPSTDPAKWISLSTNVTSPAGHPEWTQIPNEIVADGLERAAGTYNSAGGDGVWTISYTFTASGTHTDVQLTGLQWAASGDNNLLGADTITPATLNIGDKLTITWTITVT